MVGSSWRITGLVIVISEGGGMFKPSAVAKGLQIFVVFSLLFPVAGLAKDIKVSEAILAHQKEKVRPSDQSPFEHSQRLRKMGLNPQNLAGEDCALYVKQRLTRNEIARLKQQGVVVHETYVPPVPGKHESGFHLATVAYSSLDLIRRDERCVKLESTEFASKPL